LSPFISLIIGVSRFFYDRCAVISGLGVSPTSIWYFRSLCGAKYNACYFCCAMAHIFSPELIYLLRLSMLRQRIRGANATSLTAASVGGISLTLLRDALNIITLKIVIWYGAVIAQSGRQFDESRGCFFGAAVV